MKSLTLTRSLLALNNFTRRIWFKIGSFASSAMLWVVIGGSEFLFNAKILLFKRTSSSGERRSVGAGTVFWSL